MGHFNRISRAVYSFTSMLSSALLIAFLCGPPAASAANLTGLSIAPTDPVLGIGQSYLLTASGSFDDNTQRTLKQAVSIATDGGTRECAVLTDGTVQCWGSIFGTYGAAKATVPVTESGVSNAASVTLGINFKCVLLNNSGTVQCWGDNSWGELGNGTNTSSALPVNVSTITNAVAVAAGRATACAVLSDGTVKCWGKNLVGTGWVLSPVVVSGITNAVSITASAVSNHICALLADGAVKCWGNNAYGQLGDGTTVSSLIPVTVVGVNNAISISESTAHTCAVLADGRVKCWGYNSYGTLGDGTTTSSLTPVIVSDISNAVSVAVANTYSCALLADGNIKCWGSNAYGQFGNGAVTLNGPLSLLPTPGPQISNVKSITAGSDHACALLADGAVKCWGSNVPWGQLGINGNSGDPLVVPTPVISISDSAAVSGNGLHKCELQTDGSIKCWGNNSSGQVGDGTTKVAFLPVSVLGISSAVAVSAGSDSSCALLNDGSIQCWGANNVGQLGNGTTTSSLTPVAVSGITNAVSVTVGYQTACAVLVDGSVMCWGGNLGDGTSNSSSTPQAVPGISGAVSVSTAGGFKAAFGYLRASLTCVALSDGTVKCWGTINGADGTGRYSKYYTFLDSLVPVTLSISNARSVSSGGTNACALLANGTVTCWEYTEYGTVNYYAASGINNAVKISAGFPMCAVLATGAVNCWGSGGSATPVSGIDSAVGVAITGSSTVGGVDITGGGPDKSSTCVNLADHTVQCWGDTTDGRLGMGFNASGYYPLPEAVVGYDSMIWGSSDPSVASITTDGLATALNAGTTILTATVGNFTGSTTLTVNPKTYSLSTITQGSGSGSISGAGVYNAGQTATVTATANPGSTFTNWTGANAVECATGSVLMDADKICTATFTLDTHTLSLSTAGNGSGTVSGAGTYDYGTSAAVTATANTGSTFAGWSGPDGTECTSTLVLMNADKSCIATFTLIEAPDLRPTVLTASPSGTTVVVNDTVKNKGNSNITSAFTVGYYLSRNKSYQVGKDIALASGSGGSGICTRSITSLNAGRSNTGSKTCYKPTAAKTGVIYYVLVVDDAGNVIAESNETNNVRSTSNTVSW